MILDTKRLLYNLESNKTKTLESQYDNLENELSTYNNINYFSIFLNLFIVFLFLLVIYY